MKMLEINLYEGLEILRSKENLTPDDYVDGLYKISIAAINKKLEKSDISAINTVVDFNKFVYEAIEDI